MKLHEGFITYFTGDEQIMVASGSALEKFRGMARSNATAAFLIDSLKEEITRDALVEKMVARYDAPRDVIARDVDAVLNTLRSIGALDE